MRSTELRAQTGIFMFSPVLCLICLAIMATQILAGTIQSPLDEIIAESNTDEKIGVVVVMADMVDNAALNQDLKTRRATLAQRHYEVVTALQQKASDTQGPVLAVLHKLATEGKVEKIRNFWISNMISFKGTAEAIRVVADMPVIDRVVFDYPVETIKPVDSDEPPPVITSVEPGLGVINAPQVWALGYTGAGRLVSNIDTGVDGNHIALSSRWRGNSHPAAECWFDPVQGYTFPTDHGYHGTHTMGTICGRSTAGDTVGVAIEALWIGAASVDYGGTTADIIASFEFIADPDDNPETVDDVPDAVGNSW
jgi:bacillopeptidase F